MRRRGFTEYMVLYTKATDNTTTMAIPALGVFEAQQLKNARVSIDLYAFSGANMEVAVGWQLSNDRESWPGSTAALDGTFGLTAQTSEGVFYATTFDDLSSINKRYLRIVFRTKNTAASPTKPELCLAAIRVEFKRT